MSAQAFGKWILTGEHTVIRGGAALVFPVYAKSLTLDYFARDAPATCEFLGQTGNEFKLLFWGVMQKGFELAQKPGTELKGRFEFRSTVPVGAGLGASATLCVTIGKWFESQKLIAHAEVYEFARQLENLFHGESSGVDIAVALSGKGLHFERTGRCYDFETAWQPNWYISHSGQRGITSECVKKVKILQEKDPKLALQIDEDMKNATAKAEASLIEKSETSIAELASAIDLANSCFERWGLAGGQVAKHMSALRAAGAVAIKPTGSGDGGYVLSLWKNVPDLASSEIQKLELIPLFKLKLI